MANQFARFTHTSPLSSIPHDPAVSLASNAIRDAFGPTVQLVADCLQARGDTSTLAQILHVIHTKSDHKATTESNKSRTKERREVIRVSQLQTASSRDGPSTPAVRAALLVLIQHSIVTVTKSTIRMAKRNKVVYTYRFDSNRARLIPRYPRFVEYTKKALDDTAATLVEELLGRGRMMTIDAVVSTVERLQQLQESSSSPGFHDSKVTSREAVLESLRRLVGGGFVEQVPELKDTEEPDEEVEFEWNEKSDEPAAKKRRLNAADPGTLDIDDPAVVALLQNGQINKILPRDAVWRVNLEMFHESLRSLSLGWLVSERYSTKVQSAGAIVTAALKLVAYRRFAPSQKQQMLDYDAIFTFCPGDILRYLSKAFVQNFEQKPGGVISNLHKALKDLSTYTQPRVVDEVEVADGQSAHAKFQIATVKLVEYLQDRIIHQIICDSHGEVAARICNILSNNGHMEADSIAEAAMVPAKETREVLHRLYRENYISLFNLNQGKQHNPASMFYLWFTSRAKSLRNATDGVVTAFLNMRLRRQHEVEIGKDWIERAKEAGATDENENEADKLNYARFCEGLERLDTAAFQLDETLMVLKDY
jgi:DNA-directed RNA polymerase III subunit RPC3